MKKVLHLISTDVFSGAENVACQIIKYFKNNKDYDMVYCSKYGSNEQSLKERDIDVLELKAFNYKALKKAFNKYRPDIIHAHDAKACILASFFYKKALIIGHIHGNHENMRKMNFKSVLFYIISKKLKKIIWVSDSALDNYYFGNKENIRKKSIVLYNVIDSNEIYEKIKLDNKSYENYDLIYLGRLTYPKNPERLIEIINKLTKIKKDIRVAIVGTGDLENNVKKIIKKYKLENNIDLYGFVSNPYKILNNSKAMIMTSRYEGTPMCALEAISLGKPIISTPIDGLKKIVNNNTTGFLSDDDDEIVEFIYSFIEDEDKIKTFNSNVKKLNNEINNLTLYYKKINQIYIGD